MFGLEFDCVTLSEAVQYVLTSAERKITGLVVTPNVDQIVKFDNDREMFTVYKNAHFIFADGMPLVWLSKILPGNRLPERVTGADLLPAVCEAAASSGKSVFFFGGDPGIAEKAVKKLTAKFPQLVIAGTCCPDYGFENNEILSCEYVKIINASNADILFLGVGAPKQEKWGQRYLSELNVGPMLCVGAAFSFAAGIYKRSPSIVQKSGLEWLWRLLSEPRRLWRRYLIDDMRFLSLALRELSRAKRTSGR